jgi:hypothetical protein
MVLSQNPDSVYVKKKKRVGPKETANGNLFVLSLDHIPYFSPDHWGAVTCFQGCGCGEGGTILQVSAGTHWHGGCESGGCQHFEEGDDWGPKLGRNIGPMCYGSTGSTM